MDNANINTSLKIIRYILGFFIGKYMLMRHAFLLNHFEKSIP